jgi:hypothetical protein
LRGSTPGQRSRKYLAAREAFRQTFSSCYIDARQLIAVVRKWICSNAAATAVADPDDLRLPDLALLGLDGSA